MIIQIIECSNQENQLQKKSEKQISTLMNLKSYLYPWQFLDRETYLLASHRKLQNAKVVRMTIVREFRRLR